jgi:hypothetical protein
MASAVKEMRADEKIESEHVRDSILNKWLKKTPLKGYLVRNPRSEGMSSVYI